MSARGPHRPLAFSFVHSPSAADQTTKKSQNLQIQVSYGRSFSQNIEVIGLRASLWVLARRMGDGDALGSVLYVAHDDRRVFG